MLKGKLARAGEALDRSVELPTLMRPRVAVRHGGQPLFLYAVYRHRNAPTLRRFVAGTDAQTCFWALDEVADELHLQTAGSGSGLKFELLNELFRRRPYPPGSYVAVVDDDVHWVRGNLAHCLAIMQAAEFDLAQPVHSPSSNITYDITKARPRSRARWTNFVEIGPAFLASPRAAQALMPFPRQAGMGWGLETVWMNVAVRERLRMGQIDEAILQHRDPAARNYDPSAAREAQQALLRAAGVDEGHPHRVFGVWPAWRQRPDWTTQQ